jgi:hypothetical protein
MKSLLSDGMRVFLHHLQDFRAAQVVRPDFHGRHMP